MPKPDQPSDDNAPPDSGTLSDLLKEKRRLQSNIDSDLPPPPSHSEDPQPNPGTLGDLLKEKRRVQAETGTPPSAGERPVHPPKPPTTADQLHAPPVGCWVVPLVFLAFVVALFVWNHNPIVLTSSWINYEPVVNDNLAHNASKNGFQTNFSDTAWVEAYDQMGINADFDWVFSYEADGETATSFPGVSRLQSLGRRLTADEDFFLLTIAGLLLTIALTLLVNLVRLEFGWLAFSVALIGLLLDGPIYQFVFVSGNRIVTALVVLAFAFFLIGLNSIRNARRAVWQWPIAGALLGATTLFQFQMNLWLLLVLLAWVGFAIIYFIRHKTMVLSIESTLLFWIGVVIVASPWWIRNCQATGEFKSLGYAMETCLGNAYSDRAIERKGNLDLDLIVKSREKKFLALTDQGEYTLIEKERIFARENQADAKRWASDNPAKTAKLMGLRLASHFDLLNRADTPSYFWRILWNPLLLIGALIGCLLSWQRWGGIIFGMLLFSAIVVGLTWSDHGRYLVPFRPLMMVACSLGLASGFDWLSKPRRERPSSGSIQPNVSKSS